MTQQELLAALQAVNGVLTAVTPLVGGVTTLGLSLVKEIKGNGTAVGDFATEIAKFDGLVAQGIAVDDQFRADHGLPPVPNG